jgi:penicillin V acylase-like amidase (Ntn superfamily)
MRFRNLSSLIALAACWQFASLPSRACTRCVYQGPNNTVIVARSLDWAEDPGTNLYCFPRGMKRDGSAGPGSIAWTSKYGSLIASFYEVATIDGINEKGLVTNTLYLVESDYGKPDGTRPTLSIAAWAQYVLDHFATVEEAVAGLRQEPFTIIAPMLPNKEPAQGHLAISDPSGDSAIFEYVKGKLVIHHGRQYQVMTNSPTFDEQLALNKYWEEIGGLTMLPGTNRAADRFARACFYIKAIPQTDDAAKAVAATFSVIRGVSVSLGITTPGYPNISSTIWRTLYNQKEKILYFDSATSPNVFWVPLEDMDFTEGAPVRKLELSTGKTYGGNAASQFHEAKPFPFLPARTD